MLPQRIIVFYSEKMNAKISNAKLSLFGEEKRLLLFFKESSSTVFHPWFFRGTKSKYRGRDYRNSFRILDPYIRPMFWIVPSCLILSTTNVETGTWEILSEHWIDPVFCIFFSCPKSPKDNNVSASKRSLRWNTCRINSG